MPFYVIIIPKLFLNLETRKKEKKKKKEKEKRSPKCGQKLFYHHKMVPQTLTWGLTLQEISSCQGLSWDLSRLTANGELDFGG